MLSLSHNATSPYVRRISIMIKLLDLGDQVMNVECIPYTDKAFRKRNPGGLVPSLQLQDDRIINDSVAIGFYLDQEYGDGRFMSAFRDGDYNRLSLYGEIEALQHALVKLRQDAMRGEGRPVDWYITRYTETVTSVIKAMDQRIADLAELDFVSISLLCALGMTDFRNPELQWRNLSPRLAEWDAEHNENSLIGDTHPSHQA